MEPSFHPCQRARLVPVRRDHAGRRASPAGFDRRACPPLLRPRTGPARLHLRNHIVYENFGEKEGKRFVSFFCTLFIFILTSNLLGLFPMFSTATGNINVTAALAAIFMVLSLGMVLKLHGLHGLKAAFVPSGLPTALRGPMLVMEIVSFIARVFALCIRLFANMMAGHMVIYSMVGMTVVFGWVAFPALIMACLMYAFELFMAFLQAYVFTLLSAIFMNMMINPEHG